VNDDGYTLVEMLAALAIIGLAFGGLLETTRVLGHAQGAALSMEADAWDRGIAERAVARLVADGGPFLAHGAGGFTGGPQGFSFDCNAGERCGVAVEAGTQGTVLDVLAGGRRVVAVRLPGGAHLVYADASGSSDNWPLDNTSPRALSSIALLASDIGTGPFAAWAVPVEEPPGCVFDVVAQACRASP
jgi:prepilin-type N-terminal cleavage/methylation domain-containing protein